VQREFAQGLSEADAILTEWKNNEMDNRATYHKLYKMIDEFDKHIGLRYDRMTGSTYLVIIAGQLLEKYISEKELERFSKLTIQRIKLMAGIG
jgi:hypothetical protein